MDLSRNLKVSDDGGSCGERNLRCQTYVAAIGGRLKNTVGLFREGSPMMIVVMLVGRIVMSFYFVMVEEMMDSVGCGVD